MHNKVSAFNSLKVMAKAKIVYKDNDRKHTPPDTQSGIDEKESKIFFFYKRLTE